MATDSATGGREAPGGQELTVNYYVGTEDGAQGTFPCCLYWHDPVFVMFSVMVKSKEREPSCEGMPVANTFESRDSKPLKRTSKTITSDIDSLSVSSLLPHASLSLKGAKPPTRFDPIGTLVLRARSLLAEPMYGRGETLGGYHQEMICPVVMLHYYCTSYCTVLLPSCDGCESVLDDGMHSGTCVRLESLPEGLVGRGFNMLSQGQVNTFESCERNPTTCLTCSGRVSEPLVSLYG